MKTENDTIDTVFGVLYLALMPVLIFWKVFVLALLWSWFVTPVFGVPVPRYPYVLGLSVFIGLIFLRASKDDAPSTKSFIFAVLGPAVGLLFGWIATLLI